MSTSQKTDRLCRELEQAAGRFYEEIRYEEGHFHTGACTLHGKRVLFLNKRQTANEKIVALARAIACCEVASVYLKPLVRAEIERYVPEHETLSGPNGG